MKQHIVTFDDQLSAAQIEAIIQAIKQFNGVKDVLALDESPAQSLTPPSFDEPKIKITAPLNSKEAVNEPVNAAFDQTPPANEQSNPQRYAINYAVTWALRNGKVQPAAIKGMSGEKIIQFALDIIEHMPEEEKKKLGTALSGIGK